MQSYRNAGCRLCLRIKVNFSGNNEVFLVPIQSPFYRRVNFLTDGWRCRKFSTLCSFSWRAGPFTIFVCNTYIRRIHSHDECTFSLLLFTIKNKVEQTMKARGNTTIELIVNRRVQKLRIEESVYRQRRFLISNIGVCLGEGPQRAERL